MEGQDLSTLKRHRALRKGKLTMTLNELNAEMKEEDVVPDQVRELLSKAEMRLDAVEDAHDKVMEVIKNDEELAQEEEWLAGVMRDFNQVARRARRTLSNVHSDVPVHVNNNNETVNSVVPDVDSHNDDVRTGNCESNVNVDANVNVDVTCSDCNKVSSVLAFPTATQESSLISMVQAMALPKAQVKKFDGDPLFYHSLIASFNNSVSCILDPSVKLNVLRSLCCGRALEAIEYCVLKPPDEGLSAALATLKERFGNSAVIVQAWIRKIVDRPRVETSKLGSYADDLSNCYQALDALGFLHELGNQGSLKMIVEKLPKFLQQRWTREVFKLRERNQTPNLNHVVKFVRSSACEVCDPVFGTEMSTPRTAKVTDASSGHRVLQTDARVNPKWRKCWSCDSDEHWPDQCPAVLRISPEERMRVVKERRVCFSCLKRAGKGHSMATCRRKRKCLHCESFHHPLLHIVTSATPGQIMSLNTGTEEADTVMPMLTAEVQKRDVNVIFDTCATLTLVRDELAKSCRFPSKPVTVEMTTLGGEKSLLNTRAYKMTVASKQKQGTSFSIIAVGVPEITSVPAISSVLRSNVEREIGEPIYRGSGAVDVLIGINYARMHAGRCIDVGNYVTRKSPLGWAVFGADTDGVAGLQSNPVLLVKLAQPVDMTQFWSTEEMGVKLPTCNCNPKDVTLSPESDKKFTEMWESCEKVDGHWVMPYPWVKPREELPNNEKQCYAKLCSLEKRLQKNPESATQYNKAIDELVDRGFAKKLTSQEKTEYQGPVHYIPHHAVLRPESESTPVRIVFNSSSVCNGASLNDYWHKGPDLLQNINGVILRFREFKVAVAGDISKMFYRVRIPLEDMHVHRFLWRNFEQRAPDTYVLTIVTPGDKPAPAMAITALLKTAKENEADYPQAAKTLQRDTYMDDICTSVNDEAAAIELTEEVDQVLSTGGFTVKKWISNVGLNDSQDCSEKKMLSHPDEQKVLGVVWEPRSDVLKYKVQQNTVNAKLTKRIVLSEVSKVFDPIGFAGPLLIRAKIMLQRLWAIGVTWDEQLSEEEAAKWTQLFAELRSLNGVAFERCLIPEVDARKTVVIFCDASELAFGAVCYVRYELPDGSVGVRFVTAKSRVAPLKSLTIPRLELQAAVLASRIFVSVINELSTPFEQVVFFSDSVIALSWIKGQSRQYKPFVANRVAEIQGCTDPSDWRHIPGECNIADKISRGVNVDDLQGEWRSGPDFLRWPEGRWPKSISKVEASEADKEKKKEKVVMLVTQTDVAIDAAKFSSWRRLVRVTAYVQRFITNAKARCRVYDGPLSVQELRNAERYWVLEAQKTLKNLDSYKSLSPFIKDGLTYVGGRTGAGKLPYDTAHPVLLPKEHPISYLITKHVHETGHYGVATTDAKVRRNYWIVRGMTIAKTVKYRCVKCRAFEHKTENQYMADLPNERMQPFSPPFYCTAVDYFGPYDVKIGRNKTMKHYGVLFTCMNTRAVHLELATDCSTDEFLQVLRRFYAVRGKPNLIQSDNGKQFVGAERELRKWIQGWNKDQLKECCAEQQVNWRFITPLAPHHNGCVEALVKSCKHALKKAIGNQRMTPFELLTCLQEVANLVNERPIGRRPNDPDDGSYLCPNDILLGRASTRVPQGPFRETSNPRDRVAFVQRQVDAFWKVWTRDVFPLLVPRRKWNVDRRNVCVNDIILMSEPNMLRGQWKLGRVVEVYPGADGRVRSVKVKTDKGEYQRPVTKIVVLHPVEGFADQV